MSVKQAILDFVDGEIRNKIFVTPGIPAKKLNAARSQFISRDEEVIVLYDDTVFGSGKDGIAITENYIYAKQLWEVPKSIKISSIRSIESQSKSLNNLEIYLNGNLFITVSTPEKSDHAFLVGILKAAKDAAAKPEKKKGKAAPTAEAPSPVTARSAPKAKLRSAAPEDVLSCEECRAALPTGAKFCLECGTKVMPKGICLECNAKLPEKARFCPECGTPAGRAPAKSVQPKIDTEALRAELTKWLSAAGQYASIDGDGDLTLQLTAPAPSFAKNFRAWLAQCDLRISSEGVTEENNNDSSFFARGDEFSIRSPYCRVGKLASASYQMAIKLQVFSLQELEFHEIELKDGALSIPELASSQVKIKSLTTRRDDDGSFGVEYELEAYPNHVVQFDVLTEKPGSDAAVWGRVEAEATQSGTSWLWDVKPGQKIYVCFGEYKPLLDGIEAMFSGTARPAGGAYDDADEVNSSTNLSVGSVYRLEPRDKNNFKEVLELSNESGKTAYRNRTYKFGAINLTVTNTEELSYLESYLKDDYFCSSEFCQVELDHCSHLIEEDWDFENDGDRLRFEPSDNSQDLLEHLETNHGFEARSIYYEFIEGGFSTTPIDGDSQGPRAPEVSTTPSEPNEGTSANAALQRLAERTEITLTSSGRLASYFSGCDNLFISISIERGPGNRLKVSTDVDTDGQAADLEEVEELIGDYIFDTFLTPGLIEIFGEEGYEELEFDNKFTVKLGLDFSELPSDINGFAPQTSDDNRLKMLSQQSDRGLSQALKAFDLFHDPLIYDPENGRFPALNYWRDDDLENFIDNIVDNSSIGEKRGSDFYREEYKEEFGNGWVNLKVVLSRILSEDEHKRFNIYSDYPRGQLVVFEVVFDSGDYDPEKPPYLFYVHLLGDEDSGEYWGFWYQTNCGSCDPRDSECFEEMMGDVQALDGG